MNRFKIYTFLAENCELLGTSANGSAEIKKLLPKYVDLKSEYEKSIISQASQLISLKNISRSEEIVNIIDDYENYIRDFGLVLNEWLRGISIGNTTTVPREVDIHTDEQSFGDVKEQSKFRYISIFPTYEKINEHINSLNQEYSLILGFKSKLEAIVSNETTLT